MNTYHIHIGGLVQGVGFRPFVCRIAEQLKIKGWVSNGSDGVHIEFNASLAELDGFCKKLFSAAPANAIIRSHQVKKIPAKRFDGFSIHESDESGKPDLLLTPDMAICKNCLAEIKNRHNKRFQYPFTTCLECGPRYSIIHTLPYDRVNTTMADLPLCENCTAEYNDIQNRRHYSQTNSCNNCSIPIHLYDKNGLEISSNFDNILVLVKQALKDGHIIAAKGIGGYLLLCDATTPLTVETLRDRKHRPAKPFAVMYPSVDKMEEDVLMTAKEKEAVQSKTAPIVLCRLKQKIMSGLCTGVIAPGLDRIGVMLPYSPMLALIMEQWNKPLVATSGNLSGSPIVYKDEDALLSLTDYADFVLSFERDIVAPQDDSVLQFTNDDQPVIIRRSRGLAPNYFPSPFKQPGTILAMGAEMKSAFAIADDHNLYISQFLGDQGNYESQLSYKSTLQHLLKLLQCKPRQILIDSHPAYFVSQAGKELGGLWNVPVLPVQHHKAHFAAVLAENNLLNKHERVLGVVWDGTGYGEDEQVWGGEFFLLEDGEMERYMHLDYFPQLMGDKMSKEPRVSAVALLKNNANQLALVQDHFSVAERQFYLKLLQQKPSLLTSSMGRLLDGIAAILNIQSFNTYEGEAAMKLEAVARSSVQSFDHYPIALNKNRVDWQVMLVEMMKDIAAGIEKAVIAGKVFASLAVLIKHVALRAGVKKIAFSGGVFQNALLVELVTATMKNDFELFFHLQLSPNDECIGFGQIAYAQLAGFTKVQHEKVAMANH